MGQSHRFCLHAGHQPVVASYRSQQKAGRPVGATSARYSEFSSFLVCPWDNEGHNSDGQQGLVDGSRSWWRVARTASHWQPTAPSIQEPIAAGVTAAVCAHGQLCRWGGRACAACGHYRTNPGLTPSTLCVPLPMCNNHAKQGNSGFDSLVLLRVCPGRLS